jgi:hypothetical protein
MNDEFQRMWKEAVVAKFIVLSRNFPGRTEENHEILRIAGIRVEI